MRDASMNRKEFLSNISIGCLGSCACVLAGGLTKLYSEETKPDSKAAADAPPRPVCRRGRP